INRVAIVFITVGIILSTMHQSSLGSLFVMMEHRLHPLWFSPMLPVQFLTSAIAVGIAMVIFEALLSGLIFGHRHPVHLLGDLSKALPPILGIYIGLRIMDLQARGALGYVFDGSLESSAFFLEIMLGAVLPGTLLLLPTVRYNRTRLFGCVLAVIVGVVLNRLNVCIVGMLATSPTIYLPSWMEILVSAGIVAGGLLVLSVMNQTLPITGHRHAQTGTSAHA
ncbi:MAG: NrfD/PsrC family molybdoenzyme membrane anchor subunit, partial [Planctomycetota bacterium]